MRRHKSPPSPDVAVARLAADQYGVVALAQLLALGLSERAVHHRVAAGRLHRLHRGVYAVGHTALVREGRWMAAVLACGPGAALSHRTAACAWELRPSDTQRIDVITASRGRKGHRGIDLHRTRNLPPDDVDLLSGIRVTSVARTLVDLADVLSFDALAGAIHEAEVARRLDVRAFEGRTNGRRGARKLAAALGEPIAPRTRSALEHRFVALCLGEGLPMPRFNVYVCGFEVDALWAAAKVIAELDGAAVHHTRRKFHSDRARDATLIAEGYVVLRFTWLRILREPRQVAEQIRTVLRRRRNIT
jgi:Protein of unknown function (DUF559)/Transcriptional regulator, AbiEi antitoxin